MSDLTLLMATANRLPEAVAQRLREYVWEITEHNYPVVSISHRPIDFGYNLCVGERSANKYQLYWQLYLGAHVVKTKYVAVIDDDTLYSPEHFKHRPPPHTFFYEVNYWFMQLEKDYYWRQMNQLERGGGMWGCLAETKTLRENLEARFDHFPSNPLRDGEKMWFGEPGFPEGDRLYGVNGDRLEHVFSERPCLVCVHPQAMGYKQLSRSYRRYGLPTLDNRCEHLAPFGTPEEVRRKFWHGAL